jgi:hypothetical protein
MQGWNTVMNADAETLLLHSASQVLLAMLPVMETANSFAEGLMR